MKAIPVREYKFMGWRISKSDDGLLYSVVFLSPALFRYNRLPDVTSLYILTLPIYQRVGVMFEICGIRVR